MYLGFWLVETGPARPGSVGPMSQWRCYTSRHSAQFQHDSNEFPAHHYGCVPLETNYLRVYWTGPILTKILPALEMRVRINPYVSIGGVFYPPDALFMLLLWNRLELWQRFLWLFLNISWLKNAENNFQISPLVFPIWRLKNGQQTKKSWKILC